MHVLELMVQLQRHMGRKKKILPGHVSLPQSHPTPSHPQEELSLPVEHSEIAIRLNQDIFRIKMEKQTNKTVMYADGTLPLASLPSTLESFSLGRTKGKEGNRRKIFCLPMMRMPPAPAMALCLRNTVKADWYGPYTLCR